MLPADTRRSTGYASHTIVQLPNSQVCCTSKAGCSQTRASTSIDILDTRSNSQGYSLFAGYQESGEHRVSTDRERVACAGYLGIRLRHFRISSSTSRLVASAQVAFCWPFCGGKIPVSRVNFLSAVVPLQLSASNVKRTVCGSGRHTNSIGCMIGVYHQAQEELFPWPFLHTLSRALLHQHNVQGSTREWSTLTSLRTSASPQAFPASTQGPSAKASRVARHCAHTVAHYAHIPQSPIDLGVKPFRYPSG